MRMRITALMFIIYVVWNSGPACAACIGLGISVSVSRGADTVMITGTGYTFISGARIQTAPSFSPGESITVDGTGFMDGCHDVCVNGVCPPTFPALGVRLLFIQGERTLELAKVDADSSFKISHKTTLPADATSGQASIVAETFYGGRWLRTQPVAFTVEQSPR